MAISLRIPSIIWSRHDSVTLYTDRIGCHEFVYLQVTFSEEKLKLILWFSNTLPLQVQNLSICHPPPYKYVLVVVLENQFLY